MSAPFSNLRSKLARAVVAHLIESDAGTAADVLPFNAKGHKSLPNTTVIARAGRPEAQFTGNYRVLLHIVVRGRSAQAVGDADLTRARREFDDRVAKTYDAMMQGADETLRYTAAAITTAAHAKAAASPATDADLADFTALWLQDMGFGDGEPDEAGYWEEILAFEVVCCASAVDGFTL